MKKFIKSARDVYENTGDVILGEILYSLKDHLDDEDQKWFDKCTYEWEQYQNDILETIEDFEQKAKENEQLKLKLEIALQKAEEGKKQAEIKLEDKIHADRAQFINKAMIGVLTSIGFIMLSIIIGWWCGLENSESLLDKFGTLVLSAFTGSITAFVAVKQLDKENMDGMDRLNNNK